MAKRNSVAATVSAAIVLSVFSSLLQVDAAVPKIQQKTVKKEVKIEVKNTSIKNKIEFGDCQDGKGKIPCLQLGQVGFEKKNGNLYISFIPTYKNGGVQGFIFQFDLLKVSGSSEILIESRKISTIKGKQTFVVKDSLVGKGMIRAYMANGKNLYQANFKTFVFDQKVVKTPVIEGVDKRSTAEIKAELDAKLELDNANVAAAKKIAEAEAKKAEAEAALQKAETELKKTQSDLKAQAEADAAFRKAKMEEALKKAEADAAAEAEAQKLQKKPAVFSPFFGMVGSNTCYSYSSAAVAPKGIISNLGIGMGYENSWLQAIVSAGPEFNSGYTGAYGQVQAKAEWKYFFAQLSGTGNIYPNVATHYLMGRAGVGAPIEFQNTLVMPFIGVHGFVIPLDNKGEGLSMGPTLGVRVENKNLQILLAGSYNAYGTSFGPLATMGAQLQAGWKFGRE